MALTLSPFIGSVLQSLEPCVKELENIWHYIGYEDAQLEEQRHGICVKLQKSLQGCIEEANAHRVQLEARIETQRRRCAELALALRHPPYFPPHGLSSYPLLQLLQNKETELLDQHRTRIEETQRLYREILNLCDHLQIHDTNVALQHLPSSTTSLNADGASDDKENVNSLSCPTEAEIGILRDKLRELQETYDALRLRYNSLREDICRIADDICYEAESDLEIVVLSKESCQVPSHLTSQLMDELQNWRLRLVKQKAMLVGSCDELRGHLTVMWRRLEVPAHEQEKILNCASGYRPADLEKLQEEADRCQERKWSHLEDYHAGLSRQLIELCDRCFEKVPDVVNYQPSEESINEMEHHVNRLEDLYDKHRSMFDAVANYQQLWDVYVETENKMKDPAILSNRGGIMLKVDKEKKRLLKELPRVEQEVAMAITTYEKNSGSVFRLCNTLTFQDYVQNLNAQFRLAQDSAKSQRRSSRVALSTSGDHGPTLSTSPHRSATRNSKQF